ncbi:MAG TPA: hypothetical protein VJ417_01585, partial [Candidatus Glassbacteria bacterium]|nr:hypothetical protein [Candidatus Glassbacteria bacterium]
MGPKIKNSQAALLIAAFLLLTGISCTGSDGNSGPAGELSLQQRAKDVIQLCARRYASQKVLVADFYRIYRKLAYPLPVTEIYRPDFYVEGIGQYPWEIWMTWDLEQRINSLGWAAHWSGDESLRALVRRDLEALAGWPEYDVWERPHLAGAHCARIMTGAWQN